MLPLFVGVLCLFSPCFVVQYCNSESFARFYFRETSHMRSFVKIKSARNVEIRLSITDEGNSCSGANLKRGKYAFNAIRKN